MRTRRNLLAVVGAGFAALAGCARSSKHDEPHSPTEPPDTTSTDTEPPAGTTTVDFLQVPKLLPWGETATIDGTEVTPSPATVQHTAFYLTFPDALGVLSFRDRQALFVTVTVQGDGPRPAPDDFAITSDETARVWRADTDFSHQLHRGGQPYERTTITGWLLFDLPASVSASRLRVQLGGESEGAVRWPLPDDVVAALQAPPPTFAVTEFTAPETVSRDEPIPVSATVENRGNVAGTFRAAFNQTGPLYAPATVEFALEPDESRAWNTLVTTHQRAEQAEAVSFAFVTADERFERTVEVTDA